MRRWFILLLVLIMVAPVAAQDATVSIDYPYAVYDLAGAVDVFGTVNLPNLQSYYLEVADYAQPVDSALWTPITNLTGWGTEAKQKQAQIDRVKQVIGKALEGGVLRKEDEAKYEKILPTIKDSPELVRAKLNGLVAAIEKRHGRKLEALESAGYDVSRFTGAGAAMDGEGWQTVDGIRVRVKP